MKAVQIDIAKATPDQLRAECERLQIPGVRPNTRPDTLRQKLKRYKADCKLYEEWTYLLHMLPGGKELEIPAGIEALMDTVCHLLYSMLLSERYIRKPITDFANNREFSILSRQNTRVLDTTAGAYSVLHAAQCAFPAIRYIFAEWEKWRKAGNRGSR